MSRHRFSLTRQLIVGLVWLLQRLAAVLLLAPRVVPESLTLLLARPLGWLMRPGKKQKTLSSLRLVLGKTEAPATAAANRFWRAHLTHLGRNVIEPFYFFRLTDEQMLTRAPLAGEEHLSRALARGRGAVLFLNHLGNPGAIVGGLGLRYDLTIAGNAMDATIGRHTVPLRYLEGIVQRMFARAGVKRAILGDRLPQRAAETLARNGLFAMFIDFPVGPKHHQTVAFGDAFMKVNVGPAIIALRHHAVVLCVTCVRAGFRRHQLTIHPPIEPSAEGNESAAVRLMQAAMDQLLPELRAHPDQWWPWDWAQISPRD